MVDDIITRRDAEGDAPADLFQATQVEVKTKSLLLS